MRDSQKTNLLILALGFIGLVIGQDRSKSAPSAAPASPSSASPGGTSAVTSPAATPDHHDRTHTGWWPILKRTAVDISANNLMTQAAAVTFYALLSLFPAMAALVSIYGLVADPQTIAAQVDTLALVLPGGAMQILDEQLKTLTSSAGSSLGWGLVLGLGTSIWTSNQAMKALFGALNAVHSVPEKRGFFALTGVTLAATAGSIVFVVVAIVAVVVLPAILSVVGLGDFGKTLVEVLRWPLLLTGLALLLATLYRYGPSQAKTAWRFVSAGSATASILWVIVSALFSWYVGNFGSYDKTYGSLGAVVGFMTWIWISSTVVLSGAQLDAELAKSNAI